MDPAQYWDTRVLDYIGRPWSRDITPFGKQAVQHVSPGSRILELGAGAGQDSLGFAVLGHRVVMSDATSSAFTDIRTRAEEIGVLQNLEIEQIDMTRPLHFADASFDMVYSQLAMHYFDDETQSSIIGEVERVLKPDGVLAVMLNSQQDPEYQRSDQPRDGMIVEKEQGIIKRYFTVDMARPFFSGFEELLLDERGRTPKDDDMGVQGMIRFIGRKKNG